MPAVAHGWAGPAAALVHGAASLLVAALLAFPALASASPAAVRATLAPAEPAAEASPRPAAAVASTAPAGRGVACADDLDADGASALLHAAIDGKTAAVRRLLEAGADPNCRMQLRARVIIDRGADVPDGVAFVDATPLLAAAFAGHAEVVAALLAAGADADAANAEGYRPLHLAAEQGQLEVLATLIAAGAAIDAPEANGRSALMAAILEGHGEAVVALLAAGADPNHMDEDGMTPVLAAIDREEVEIFGALLAAGADPSRGTSEVGLPALLAASAVASREMVESLLERGIDPNVAHWVSSAALAEFGVEIEPGFRVQATPMMLAAHTGSIEVARALRRAGADPTFATEEGVNPLLVAIFSGHAEFAEWVLAHGTDANHRTQRGETALILAVEQANVDLARVLLEAGADPDLGDDRGLTPMRAARDQGSAELVALLARHGARAESDDDALHQAAVIDTVGFDPRGSHPVPDRREPLGIALDPAGGWLYWSEYRGDRIRRARLDGSAVETVLEGRAEGPIGVAVDPAGERLFWTSDASYPRRVRVLQLRDRTWEALAEGMVVNRPRAIAAAADSVVWTEAINGRIRQVRAGDPTVIEIFSDGISSFGDRADFQHFFSLGVAVSPAADRLYWSDAAGAVIETMRPDGSDRRILFEAIDGLDFPAGIAVDDARGELYWADIARAALWRAPLRGGPPQVVVGAAAGLVEPRAIALDAAAGKLYWTDASRDWIGRADLDGGGVEILDLAGVADGGFTPLPSAPQDCAAAVRRAAAEFRLGAVKRLALCMEKVDVFKAVKRDAADARNAVPTCVGQLAPLLRGGGASLEAEVGKLRRTACGDTAVPAAAILDGCGAVAEGCAAESCAAARCRSLAWRDTAARHLRTLEWMAEVRPFVVEAHARAGDAQRGTYADALEVLDEVAATVGFDAGGRAREARLPQTGMVTSYRAVRAGSTAGVPVPDDAALRQGAAMRFRDNRDGTVTDRVTGLMWEKKCDGCGGLHEVGESYPWSSDGASETIWDWLDALNRKRGVGFAGFSDWRIPNIKELQSIVDYEVFNPAVPRAFHGDGCGVGCRDLSDPACSCTQMSAYWSSTTYADGGGRAFALMFHLGLIGDRGKEEPLYVRAVRGGPSAAAADSGELADSPLVEAAGR